jgi:hypothetical protein
MDILDKLREQQEWYSDGHGELHKRAADEIERLRATLRVIADGRSHDPQLDALRVLE